MNWIARLALPIALACLAFPALAEKRVALVIGNAAYKHAPALANPKNDAEGVAASLRRLNFDVLLGVDLDEAGMRRILRGFADKVEGLGKDDVALVFYAGHGLQVNGRNYLVPVDAKLEKESDLGFQAVALDFLQQLMEQTPHTNIVILDSCRDNPLARTLARGMGTRSAGIGRGLAEMRGVNDTLIVYATNPGNVALDGEGRHSPFTEALLKHVETPGLEVRHMISQVRSAVIAATKGKQVPWEAASLTRQIYFTAAPAAPPPAASTPPPPTDNEGLFWQSIKDSSNIAHFKAYLARWPQGVFADLARIKVEELEKAALRAEEERKRKDDEAKKEIPAQIERARQSIKDARAALAAKRYADAKRHAAAAKAASDQVIKGDAASSEGQALARDAASLSKDVADALTVHVRAQLVRARQLVNASRFDEAKRILDEAARLTDGSPEVAAARREYEAARAKSATVRKPDTAAPDAPRRAASPVEEIRRKALAKEPESGFCATTGWPLVDPSVDDKSFFDAHVVGSFRVARGKYNPSACYVWRITRLGTTAQGQKCVMVEFAGCSDKCGIQRFTYESSQRSGTWKADTGGCR